MRQILSDGVTWPHALSKVALVITGAPFIYLYFSGGDWFNVWFCVWMVCYTLVYSTWGSVK